MKNQSIYTCEEVVKGLIRSNGIQNLAIGLHNALAHGDILTECDTEFTEADLGKLFKGVDQMVAASKKMHP